MDQSVTVKLISKTYAADSIGQQVATEVEKTIFGQLQSVSQQEFYNGGQLGLKPEYKITVFAPEYAGQDVVEVNGVRYSVYRTYVRNDEQIELYCERKVGNGV